MHITIQPQCTASSTSSILVYLIFSKGVGTPLETASRQAESTIMLDWLDDSRHPILWMLIIYPNLIIILYLFYCLTLSRLIEDLPLVLKDPIGAKGESSATKDTSPLDYVTVPQSSLDTLTKPKLEASSDNEMDTQIPPVIVETQHTSTMPATDTSRQTAEKFRWPVLLFCIQLLLAHRAGVLAARHMRQTQGAGKLIGILGITIVTILVSLAMGFVLNARSNQLRGYRTGGINRARSNPSDPLSGFIFYSWLSMLIPCIRCLLLTVG